MTVITKKELLAEIGAIYDAALDPTRWQDFFDLYAKRYPGAGIYLWSVFGKTATHSQIQLVSLLFRTVAVSGDGGLEGD